MSDTEPTESGTNPDRGFLARRLGHLFATVHPEGRGPYKDREAAEQINASAGEQLVSPTYLWQLRTGKRTDPSLRRASAIAAFFKVKLDYFNERRPEDKPSRWQLALAQALIKVPIQRLAIRADGLSPRALTAVAHLVESLREIEGLREGDGDPLDPEDPKESYID